MEKTYHYPDWERAPEGTSFTDYALCGQYTRAQEDHWFAWFEQQVNCDACKRLKLERTKCTFNPDTSCLKIMTDGNGHCCREHREYEREAEKLKKE